MSHSSGHMLFPKAFYRKLRQNYYFCLTGNFKPLKNMKRYISLLIILCCFGPASLHAGTADFPQLYKQLEQVLAQRQTTALHKENRIDSIRRLIHPNLSASTLYQLYNQIFEEYYVYRSDSALYYVDLAEKTANRLNDIQKQQQCIINRSLQLATIGYFSQALEQLNGIERARVDSTMLLNYYTAFEWVYSVWSEYSNDDVYAPQFRKKEILYNDSMLQVLPRESNEYYYWKGELKARTGNQFEAQQAYEKALQGLAVNTRLYACVTCGLAFAFKRQGNFREYEKYLILSSISDNICPLKENLAMQELAMFLYETSEKELEKANRYLNYSMEDAMFYNNRLRMLEIARKFPSIVSSYQQKSNDKSERLTRAICFISLLSLLLAVSIFYIYRQMQQLGRQRKAVTHMNSQLTDLNNELLRTNHIREEYVSLFLDLCAAYIDKLNRYQDLVKRKVKAKQTEDLAKLANNKMSENDAKHFFVNFDTAFLTLYPTFIEEFNALLREGEEIIPQKGETLNTELRIFALVRLGIKDSSRIATLLFYSPQTIYNYRTAVRNRARDRESFEEKVKQLCLTIDKNK